MTRQELMERYPLSACVLAEYDSWDFCREPGTEYTPGDVERLSLLLTLLDIGFTAQEAKAYMRSALQEPDRTRPRLRLLEEKRAALLGDIHQREQKLQRLDYLRYELQKANGASDL